MIRSTDELERGREASDARRWREAFDLLSAADRGGQLDAPDLERLAEAAYWIGSLASAIDARERAYTAYRKMGDALPAARVALELCTAYGMKGDGAMHKGWHRRAERLLEGLPENPQHGYLERRRAAAALSAGDHEAALAHGRECEAIGLRVGDPNVQALGLHEQGRALVQMGDAEPGLALLEEAIVAAISGELDPGPTGTIYCNAINVCRELTDYQRAGEWTDAAKRWCDRMAVSGFPGICRVRKAEITRLRGAWAEAEQEARRAVDELRDYYVEIAAAGLYEIGEIRLRLGDLEAAEEAFRQANELGEDPQPGMAALHLRAGRVDAAASSIRRSLAEETSDRLRRARLLPTQVEIAIEAGDLESARAAATELEEIAETYRSTALGASAAVTGGRVLVAEGDIGGGADAFRRGRKLWAELDAPYEAAEARMLLGLAYRAAGDEDATRLELEAARGTFEQIGAVPDMWRVDELLGDTPRRAASDRAVDRTFMFTDIVGSTGLVEAIGDEAWGDLQRWHDEMLRSTFAEHAGQEVDDAGDGFFVAFPDARSAIECAVAIQRRLANHRRTHGFSPSVRIGVHASEARTRAGAYRGKGVHEAARIGGRAEGGQILVSTASLPADVRFRVSAPRKVELKGIAQPIEVAAVDWRP